MIKVNRTFIRPNLEAPWHIDDPFRQEIYNEEFTTNVKENYKGKLHYLSNDVSSDGLVLHFESVWETLEDYERYMVDPISCSAWARRDQHNNKYNITSDPSTITIM